MLKWPHSLLFACASLPALASAEQASSRHRPIVQTVDGAVVGTERDGVRVFTKLPYAAAPIGPLRFRAPQPPQRRLAPLVADQPIPACIQFGPGMVGGGSQSEDCLYLSVWAPIAATRARPMPVMVWLFGGGLVGGSAQDFDGAALARRGVVVVTVNFRVGVLGLLADASLDGPEPSGNYIIRDQQAALRWVRDNIAGFGGDPANVTIFGQSSGASTVLMQVMSPAARGLFSKAIVESSGEGAIVRDRAAVEAGAGHSVVEAVGCADRADVAACLRSLPAEAFVDARVPMSNSGALRNRALGLVTDPALLPMSPLAAFKAGMLNPVAVMSGTNVSDGAAQVIGVERQLGHPLTVAELPGIARDRFFGDKADAVLSRYPVGDYAAPDVALAAAVTDFRQACPTDATRLALAAKVSVYAYEMTEPDAEPNWPAPEITSIPNRPRHTTEVAYVFGQTARLPATARAMALSARFQRYWTDFAKTGMPGATERDWPRFTAARRVVASIEEPPHLSTQFAAEHHCATLRDAKLVDY